MTIQELAESSPNLEILNSWLVTDNKLKRCRKAMCAISGGSDSDILLHLCATLDTKGKVTYVFFDTGLEFQATKQHIKDLEDKYNIKIVVQKAVKPIPTCCRQYGVPFLSKYVSDMISRLQRHNFKWEDKPFDELYAEYPKCKTALLWWCNAAISNRFHISRNKYLKEFLIANPPTFKISGKCCHYAKKLPSERFKNENQFDLRMIGVRKSEGGIRDNAYKNCFTPATENSIDEYRPVFWYTSDTKSAFNATYGITNSDCYEVWGLKRTGCSGCPFGRNLEAELAACEKYEPKMYKALNNVFGASYEYTRQYREYQRKMRGEIANE